MAYAYANLMNPVNTGSGVAEYLLLAPVTAFTDDGIKCPEAPFTNPGDEVTVREAHEFLQNEGFIKVQLAPEKNQLNAATIGDRGFAKLDMTLDVFIPGSYAAAHEAVKNWLNKPLIALIKDAECKENMYYQLGCDCASAWLSVDFSTGTTKDGVKGYSGKLTYQNGYIQVYMGPAPKIKGSGSTPTVGLPVFTTQPTGSTVTVGSPFSLAVVATNATSYQLQKLESSTWTDVTGANSSPYTKNSPVTGDSGSYRWAVTNSVGTVYSNAVTVTVNAASGGTYDTILDFTSNKVQYDTEGGITAVILAPSSIQKLKYNKKIPQSGLAARMDAKMGATPVLSITGTTGYEGWEFVYTDENGVDHILSFEDGTVTL